MLLLNSAFLQQPVIANNFNYSLIKIRIKMITKIKSSKTAALKLSMGILVTAALLVIFACDNKKKPAQDNITTNKQEVTVVKSVVKSMENVEAASKAANVVVDSMVIDGVVYRKQPSLPTDEQTDEQVYIVVEEQATFQGGDVNSFRTWVTKNLKYPDIAVKKGISGKVYVQYAINSKGDVVDVKVVRGVDPTLDKEAVRVISSSPKWEPAKQRGTKVKQQFTIPIVFVNDQQKSQQTDEQVFIVVEKPASFQGGDVNSFFNWVTKNLTYPTIAIKNKIEGKVYVQFAINSNGEVVDVKVVRGVDPSLDKEAVRVISSSPKWEPAKQKGTNVKQQFTIPIAFQLQ